MYKETYVLKHIKKFNSVKPKLFQFTIQKRNLSHYRINFETVAQRLEQDNEVFSLPLCGQ